jgi:uncharacterized protein YuzE
MDNNSIPARPSAGTVRIAGIDFDNNFYDAEGDVLYLHVGDPKDSVAWDGTPEGDGTSYGSDGSLIGLTILNARLRLVEDGKIVLTLPERQVEARDLDAVLTPA